VLDLDAAIDRPSVRLLDDQDRRRAAAAAPVAQAVQNDPVGA
jgi:hypothetical protein